MIGTGAAVGALLVTLTCAAIAGESLRIGATVLDWFVGIALVAGPLALICGVLALATGGAAWIVRRLQARAPARVRPLGDALLAGLRLVGRAWVGILAGIVVLIWGSTDEGPLAIFHGLFFFEILIAIGALAGLLVGIAVVLHRERAGRRGRRLAGAILAATALLGVATTGWAAGPGQGDPVRHEDAAALAAVRTLDLPDPSTPGEYTVAATSYGSGHDRRRVEYGTAVGWTAPTVDASAALPGRGDVPGMYADWVWGFDSTRLPLGALVWYPVDAPGRRPLVLIVHGNHLGPHFSDPGYAYLGEHLASRGYVVASIDENYLNGDAFFDYGGEEMDVRAWLLLRHIELFAAWDRQAGHQLEGRVDVDRVALTGHSRGGEAVALASMMRLDPALVPPGLAPITTGRIRTLIAIAPSDRMHVGAGTPVQPRNLDYLVMQGAHDGDLPGYSGLRTYHRVLFDPGSDHLKVALFSQGANHGRFNSVWDDSDAGPLPSWLLDRGSLLSAADQERLARTVITAFLARSLDGARAYEAFFRDPRSGRDWLPDDVIQTHWETSARTVVAGDGPATAVSRDARSHGFDRAAGVDPTLRDGVPQSDRATALRWSGPAEYTVAVDGSRSGGLDRTDSMVFSMAPWVDPGDPVDPLIELVFDGGVTASVPLSAVSPSRPLLPSRLWKIEGAGDRYLPTERRVLGAERFMQTHELPLATLMAGVPEADPAALRSIRFRFETPGSVLLDDVGFEPGVDGGP